MELFLKPLLVRSTGPSTFSRLPEKSVLVSANYGRGGEAKLMPPAEVKVRIEQTFCVIAEIRPLSFTVLNMDNYQDALASLADRYLESVQPSKSSDEPTPLPPDQLRPARQTPSKSVVVPRVSPSPKQQVRQVRRRDQGAWVTK